jgi:WD40 repeat protein
VAFSPDGRTLASGSADSTIMQWDAATHSLIGHPLRGHTGYVFGVAYSPDGKTLASGSEDGTIRLWDSSTHQALGQPLSSNTGAVYSIAFSPDGKRLASGSHDGTVTFWDVDWQSRVCEVVGRNLTQLEWVQYLPSNQSYRKTCPNWPADNADTVNISIYSSKSKEDWINAATAAFNAAQTQTLRQGSS